MIRRFVVAAVAVITMITAMPGSASGAVTPMLIRNHLFSTTCLSAFHLSADNCVVTGNWLFIARDPARNSWSLVAQNGDDNTCLEQYPARSAHLRLAWCSSALGQSWIPQRQDDPPGVYNRLINEESWQCLDMSGHVVPPYPTPVPTGVVTAWPCAPGVAKPNQLWTWNPRR
jgi:hypothetical protein